MTDSYQDFEEDEGPRRTGRLPLALASMAMAGFLAVPTVGILNRKDKQQRAKTALRSDEIPVALQEGDGDYIDVDLGKPNPEDIQMDLRLVDETLAGIREDNSVSVPDRAVPLPTVPVKSSLRSTVPVKTAAPRSDSGSGGKTVVEESLPNDQPWVVHSGDTLYGIGRETGRDSQDIARYNKIDPDESIQPGQVLRIPPYPSANVRPIVVASPSPRPVPRDQMHVNRTVVQTKPVPQRERAALPRPAPPKRSDSGGAEYTYKETYHYDGPEVVNDADYWKTPAAQSPSVYREEVEVIPSQQRTITGGNPLDRYGHVITYRVQMLDSMKRIANAHSLSSEELIESNGRSNIRPGEVIVVPVDNCLIKNGY